MIRTMKLMRLHISPLPPCWDCAMILWWWWWWWYTYDDDDDGSPMPPSWDRAMESSAGTTRKPLYSICFYGLLYLIYTCLIHTTLSSWSWPLSSPPSWSSWSWSPVTMKLTPSQLSTARLRNWRWPGWFFYDLSQVCNICPFCHICRNCLSCFVILVMSVTPMLTFLESASSWPEKI